MKDTRNVIEKIIDDLDDLIIELVSLKKCFLELGEEQNGGKEHGTGRHSS